MESVEIMGKTEKLTTFLSRHEDARRFIRDFNGIMVQTGQDQILEMYDDVDRLFAGRIGEVVDGEVAGALLLRTANGRQDRLQRIVEELERVDRPDEGIIDDAIMEAEGKAFSKMNPGKTAGSGDLSVGVSEDQLMELFEKAAIGAAKKKGFSDSQIKQVRKDVFGK